MAHGLRVSPPCSMIVNWCIASHAVAVDHGAVEDGLVFRASAYGDQQGVTTTRTSKGIGWATAKVRTPASVLRRAIRI